MLKLLLTIRKIPILNRRFHQHTDNKTKFTRFEIKPITQILYGRRFRQFISICVNFLEKPLFHELFEGT